MVIGISSWSMEVKSTSRFLCFSITSLFSIQNAMKSKLMFSIRSPGNAFVEGDASSASYFLAGAAVTGGTITVNGCGTSSLQVFMLDTIFYYLLFYGLYCIIPNSTPFFSLSPHFQKNRAYHCILNSSCMSFFVS